MEMTQELPSVWPVRDGFATPGVAKEDPPMAATTAPPHRMTPCPA